MIGRFRGSGAGGSTRPAGALVMVREGAAATPVSGVEPAALTRLAERLAGGLRANPAGALRRLQAAAVLLQLDAQHAARSGARLWT